MAKYHFNALDKDSSASFSKTIIANDLDELKTAWTEFKENVPFSRWYSDNESDELINEHNLEKLV